MLLTVLLGTPGSGKTTLLENLKSNGEIDIILGDDILSPFFSEKLYNSQEPVPLHSFNQLSEVLELLFRTERKKGINFFTNPYKWGVSLITNCQHYNKTFVNAPRMDLDTFIIENISFQQINFMEYKPIKEPICRIDFRVDINSPTKDLLHSYEESKNKNIISLIDEYFNTNLQEKKVLTSIEEIQNNINNTNAKKQEKLELELKAKNHTEKRFINLEKNNSDLKQNTFHKRKISL